MKLFSKQVWQTIVDIQKIDNINFKIFEMVIVIIEV